MKLGRLLNVLGKEAPLPHNMDPECEVGDITHDSRQVAPGSIFVAVRGFNADGHRFISQAVERGAVCIVAERGAGIGALNRPVVLVDDTREALSLLALEFFGRPSERLKLIGITGTNGKTTTSYLTKSAIEAAGGMAGLIGTIDYRIGDKVYPAPNTTPESIELQRLLSGMLEAGASHCVMEVSSHALELGRTKGCVFEAAAFTNLTQDHLDFHKDMESYFRAKLRLFTGLAKDKTAVVNMDDPRSGRIMASTQARVITFGMSEDADVRPEGMVEHSLDGLAFRMKTPIGPIDIETRLVGRHNVYNILAAAGISIALGLRSDDIYRGIKNMQQVPGRMEKIDEGQGFGVIVDYAHTEDALVRLLEAVREMSVSRVITVFGCGGDRDRSKRPKMGRVAINASDLVILTSDNPRSEDPLSIIAEIEEGMKDKGTRLEGPPISDKTEDGRTPYLVIPDRRAAIETAMKIARQNDVVVLAGKGHEDYQIVGHERLGFDDREEARRAIRKALGR